MMNLSGSLGAFGVADLLTLLSMGSKSGVLRVSRPGRSAAVWLLNGQVSSATSDEGRAGLLRRLVATGAVDAAELAVSCRSAAPVRDLVERGCLDGQLAQQVAVEEIVDATSDLLAWDEGEFAVSVEDLDAGDIGVRLPIDALIAAAKARLSDWDEVRAGLPAPEAVLVLAPDVADDAVLTRQEWAIVALVDSRLTVREVVELGGPSLLSTSATLSDLIARGFIAAKAHTAGLADPLALIAALEAGGVAPAVESPPAADTPTEVVPEPHRASAADSEPVVIPPLAEDHGAIFALEPAAGFAQPQDVPDFLERTWALTDAVEVQSESVGPPDSQPVIGVADPVEVAPSYVMDWAEPRPTRRSHAAPESALVAGNPVGGTVPTPRAGIAPAAGDEGTAPVGGLGGPTGVAAAAVAIQPVEDEDDESDGLSRGLLMQLIAGVRGL